MKRDSNYFKFFQHAFIDLTETGQWDVIKRRQKSIVDENIFLAREQVNSLSFTKIISLFIVLALGALLSLCISIFECSLRGEKETNLVKKHSQYHQLLLDSEQAIKHAIPVLKGTVKQDAVKMLKEFQTLRNIQ